MQNDIVINDPFSNSGDFNIQDADYQNIQAIVFTNKGQFYQSPLLGVNIFGYINSPDDLVYLKSTIMDELAKDNYTLIDYEAFIEDSKLRIYIDATYIQ